MLRALSNVQLWRASALVPNTGTMCRLLDIGHGSSAIATANKDANLLVASDATNEAIAYAANGRGAVLRGLQDLTGLR